MRKAVVCVRAGGVSGPDHVSCAPQDRPPFIPENAVLRKKAMEVDRPKKRTVRTLTTSVSLCHCWVSRGLIQTASQTGCGLCSVDQDLVAGARIISLSTTLTGCCRACWEVRDRNTNLLCESL